MTLFSSNALLITANVGSLFEDPINMLQKWLEQLFKLIESKEPDFIAIHCQEVGGKNFEESMQYVDHFIKALLASPVIEQFDKARIYLDEDFTAQDKFTALGNLYFIHETVQDVQLWNFHEKKFYHVEGREVFSGSIESVPCKEKSKFPIDFFPDCKWSRKGFLRTRWQLNQVKFDLVNVHLFHDVSNLKSVETNPSVYCGFRSRALQWTLDRFQTDEYETIPYFIFGDFNFRLNLVSLIKHVAGSSEPEEVHNKKNELSKVIYKNPGDNRPILTVEKKAFDRHEQHNDFFLNSDKWLRQFDTELDQFSAHVREFDIPFPPSYPFSEDLEDGLSYMRTRCPSWCDRIVLSHSCIDILCTDGLLKPEYDMIGKSVCMGDHKPIYLSVHLKGASPGRLSEVCGRPVVPHVASAPSDRDPASTLYQSTKSTSVASLTVPSPGPAPEGPRSGASTPSDAGSPSTHRHSLSVNGLVTPEGSDPEVWNVFDYAVFEHEGQLSPAFRFSHKHNVYSGQSDPSGQRNPPSFTALVRDVARAEGVIIAFKGPRHRRRMSDSSTETTENEEDQTPDTQEPCLESANGKGDASGATRDPPDTQEPCLESANGKGDASGATRDPPDTQEPCLESANGNGDTSGATRDPVTSPRSAKCSREPVKHETVPHKCCVIL